MWIQTPIPNPYIISNWQLLTRENSFLQEIFAGYKSPLKEKLMPNSRNPIQNKLNGIFDIFLFHNSFRTFFALLIMFLHIIFSILCFHDMGFLCIHIHLYMFLLLIFLFLCQFVFILFCFACLFTYMFSFKER